MKPSPFGLPGKISDTALALPPGLSYEQVRDGLQFIGRTSRALSFWAGDLLLFAEAKFGEGRFSQLAEEIGWHPHTLQTVMSVCRAFPPKRRREALEFGHHAALARLEPEDQDHYATLAEKGDLLPNLEKKRWSVSRLRQELRALNPRQTGVPGAKTASMVSTVDIAIAVIPNPDVVKRPPPVLAIGEEVAFADLGGRFRIVGIYRQADGVVVKALEIR